MARRANRILSLPTNSLHSLFPLPPPQNAVMTFEEEKMAFALAALKAAEKRCSSNSPTAATAAAALGLGGRLSSSPSFSSLQAMKSRFQGLLQGQTGQQQGCSREGAKVSFQEESFQGGWGLKLNTSCWKLVMNRPHLSVRVRTRSHSAAMDPFKFQMDGRSSWLT